MLEVLVVVFLTKKLAAIAKAKGRSAGWAALGPVLWILGEITGAVVAGVAGVDDIALYIGALAGAALGGGIAWVIVNALSGNEQQPGAYEEAFRGGAYDPKNPYNAPGTAPQGNPYMAGPPRSDAAGGPFDR